MSFYQDPSFFILLAFAVGGAAVIGIAEKPLKWYGLLVSLGFLTYLFFGDWLALGEVAAYVALSYLASIWTLSQTKAGGGKVPVACRILALVVAIGPLVTYKVTVAAGHGILGFVGISYITFKATQVLLEIEDGLIDHISPIDYAYFLCFFPVFTSGPIDRSRRFVADANRVLPRGRYLDLLSRGLVRVLIGMAYQIVLAAFFKKQFNPVAFSWSGNIPLELWNAVVASYAYGLYLFFDFAGYSLMAQGASMCLGIETPDNFRQPYLAKDISDFWDRWHITLSHWLRDFVFMRLERTLARKKVPKKRDARAAVGLVANMLLMGAWHGLTPQYLLYGLYHGVLLGLLEVAKHRSKFYRAHKGGRVFGLVMWFVTMNVVIFGFAIFSGQAFTFFGGMFHG